MTRKYVTFFMLFVAVFFCITSAHAQMTKVEKGNWLPGMIFKLENMRDNSIADIQRYKSEIQKCNSTIGKCKNIIGLARQKGNAEAEKIAKSALAKATEAKNKNEETLKIEQFHKELLEKEINELKKLIVKNETNKPEKINNCEKLEAQLARDKDVIKKYQKIIDMRNIELEKWTKMNEEAAKDAVKKGIELMADAISFKLEEREAAVNGIAGELKKYKAQADLSGLPEQQELADQFLSKWSRAQDAYNKVENLIVAGKAIDAGLTAKGNYEDFKNGLVKAKALINDADNNIINTLEDPETRASIAVAVINLGDKVSKYKNIATKTNNFFGKATSFASFIVNYTYDATKWMESRDRILQFSELAEDELKAVNALGKQIKRTMGKLKECRERAKNKK